MLEEIARGDRGHELRDARRARNRRFGTLGSLLIPFLIACSPPDDVSARSERRAGSPANDTSPVEVVVLVVVDTLRPDYLGAYGANVATPVIDGLARQGVLFRQAYAHVPITGPSHASLFTSTLPSRHGVHNNDQRLPAGLPTLAERFAADGWETAGFVSLGVLNRRFGFRRGFETYRDAFHGRWWKTAGEVNAELLPWIGANDRKRGLFLFVHYSDPHTPYTPPGIAYPSVIVTLDGVERLRGFADAETRSVALDLPAGRHRIDVELAGEARAVRCLVWPAPIPGLAYGRGFERMDTPGRRERWVARLPASAELNASTASRVEIPLTCEEERTPELSRERYRLEVESLDRELGRLLALLEERGLARRAVVAFTSDHGEALGDHGFSEHVEHLYESMIRVPLLLVAPGRLPAGVTVETPVRLIDVAPTLLELAGIDVPAEFAGRSLAGAVADSGAGTGPVPHVAMTYRPEAEHDRIAVRDGTMKLIVTLSTGEVELYDVALDPAERRNLAPGSHAEVRRLRALLLAELERQAGAAAPSVDLTEEDAERLRSLGYLD